MKAKTIALKWIKDGAFMNANWDPLSQTKILYETLHYI